MKEKRNVKKLVLNRETVRTLQDAELGQVAGGVAYVNGSVPTICSCITCGACPPPTQFCPNEVPDVGEAF